MPIRNSLNNFGITGDTNLAPSNIKKDVMIEGVIGNKLLYGTNDKVSLTATQQNAPIIKYPGYSNANSQMYILGEDNSYIYLRTGNGTYYLTIYNKLTGTVKNSTDQLPTSYLAKITSNNDGYVYMYFGTSQTIKKINCSTGATVWTYSTNYAFNGDYNLKYYNGYLYVIYTSSSSGVIYEKIDPSAGTRISISSLISQTGSQSIILDKYFYTFYSGTVYQFDITTGSQVATWIGLASNVSAIDYLNQVYFSNTATSVIAFNYSKVQQWTYALTFPYAPSPFVIMRNGYFCNDYQNGNNIKLNINGTLAYKQTCPVASNWGTDTTRFFYMYDTDGIIIVWQITVSSNTYNNLGQYFESVTLS
ncbi:hypothetical protein [Heyndrickxia acidicola]|uniref:Uncharacterized protein n=1 Tax=Heyndrickxia acidicola TaxID=209389 RepID=A0ABU6MC13_9BACI|nr:hypothetical protein [Heyndrickxia acidicola]MED1201937.1 hypothetical protein [Heyndrickxia acidicola]